MLKTTLPLLIVLFLLTSFSPPDFIAEQKKYERVREAFVDKEVTVKAQLKKSGLQSDDFHLLIVAYKDDDVIELFARNKAETTYKKLITYEVCARSGVLGPKRKSGDLQVPEGFYHINRFNPSSNFYLSLGLNYPNASDKIKSDAQSPGGDIFIHGSCVTIGCLPMTDDKIKEIYLYAIHAKNNGQQKIPVKENADFFIVGDKPIHNDHVLLKRELICNQMVLEHAMTVSIQEQIVELQEQHREQLFQLVNKIQPGYFRRDTARLGKYFGIVENDQLIAAAGERMKMNNYTEVSAVVTDPAHTGKGLASQLMAHVSNRIFEEGKIPFLHVVESNTNAIRLYEKLGFVTRKKMSLWNFVKTENG